VNRNKETAAGGCRALPVARAHVPFLSGDRLHPDEPFLLNSVLNEDARPVSPITNKITKIHNRLSGCSFAP
jgi:hypothetical protein